MEQQNILSLSLQEYKEQIDSLKESLEKLNEDSSEYLRILQEAKTLQDNLIKTLQEAGSVFGSVSDNVNDLSSNLSNLGDINIQTQQLTQLNDELTDIIYSVEKIVEKQVEIDVNTDNLEQIQQEINDISDSVDNINDKDISIDADTTDLENVNDVLSDIEDQSDVTVDSISNLTKSIEDMKSQLNELEIGSEAFNEMADKVKAAQERLAKLKDQIGDNADSIVKLKSTMVSAFSDIGLGLDGLDKAFGAATAASNGLKTSFDLLKAHPIIAVLTLFVGILLKIKDAFASNEAASRSWSVAMAAFQPIIDAFNSALGYLAEGLANIALWFAEKLPGAISVLGKGFSYVVDSVGFVVQAVLYLPAVFGKVFDSVVNTVKTGIEKVTGLFAKLTEAVGLDSLSEKLKNVTKSISDFSSNVGGTLDKFSDKTKDMFDSLSNSAKNFGNSWSKTTDLYMKKQKEMFKLEDDIREQEARNAESALKVAELRKQAAEEKDLQKRLEIYKEIDNEIIKNGKEQVELAKRQYELAVWYGEQAPNSKADNERLAKLKANVSQVEATYTNSLAKISKQEQTIQEAIRKAAEAQTKEEKAEYEKQIKELEKAEKEKLKIANEYVKNFNETIKNLQTEASQQTKVLKSEEDIAKSLGVLSPAKQKEFEEKRYQVISESNDKILAEYQKMLENTEITEEQRLQIQAQYSNKMLDIIISENEHKSNLNKIALEDINKTTEEKLKEQEELYKNTDIIQQYTEMYEGLRPEVQEQLVNSLSVDEETKQQILDNLAVLNEDIKNGTYEYDLQAEEQEHQHQLDLIEIQREAAEQIKEQFGEDSEEYLEAREQLNQLEEDEELRHAQEMANIHKNMDLDQKKTVDLQIKTYSQLAKSTASLFGNISQIMKNNIDEKVKNGEISEEEAKKEFERAKKMQIAETVVNTIAGAAGGFLQAVKTYPAPWGPILGAATAATALTAGYAQVQQIKAQEYGSSNTSGSGGTPSVSTVDFDNVSVNPLLDENRDIQSMTSLNVNGDSDSVQQTEQKVYILQSDINDSNRQTQVRQNETHFK